MAGIITIFGTGEGQTAKVAERIDAELRARGHETTTVNVKEIDPGLDIDDFDAVLVGASIHMGRQQKAVRKFVNANQAVLARKPNGFFQVSGSSGEETEEGAAEAARYVDEFIEATNWHPDRIGLFGGALRFSEYGFLMRALVKFVARVESSEENPLADVEYTDWEEVEAFANEFATFVEERLGETAED
ncbi:menaquinone-dependent protoporphyrinogen oxidase [Haladaptatus litoreus]|uniref:Menaquinone-dependent protoporphyrinogen oxidase n=1 Tax=Haladaptatus litoreus TaxID=553468 RepID=A0A1N7EGP4_9EURY|nr:flavodoxin domain-containing protein [Haladaptatus litoreus]SIR87247.1 menaquinone-dependent protoporphyrinogen oxidase [Haladaptatus litoreus]